MLLCFRELYGGGRPRRFARFGHNLQLHSSTLGPIYIWNLEFFFFHFPRLWDTPLCSLCLCPLFFRVSQTGPQGFSRFAFRVSRFAFRAPSLLGRLVANWTLLADAGVCRLSLVDMLGCPLLARGRGD